MPLSPTMIRLSHELPPTCRRNCSVGEATWRQLPLSRASTMPPSPTASARLPSYQIDRSTPRYGTSSCRHSRPSYRSTVPLSPTAIRLFPVGPAKARSDAGVGMVIDCHSPFLRSKAAPPCPTTIALPPPGGTCTAYSRLPLCDEPQLRSSSTIAPHQPTTVRLPLVPVTARKFSCSAATIGCCQARPFPSKITPPSPTTTNWPGPSDFTSKRFWVVGEELSSQVSPSRSRIFP